MNFIQALKSTKYSKDTVELDSMMLDKLHIELSRMITDISKVMENYGIHWSLSGGSILGAIRHKGFIPWDDDIDIFITRSEYEKLKKVFDKDLGEKYKLRQPGEKGYLFHFPKIEDKRNRIQSVQSVGEECTGLQIDVFILENTFDNALLRTFNGMICSAFLFIISCERLNLCKENILKYTENDPNVKKIVESRAKFSKIFGFFSCEKWISIAYKYFGHIKREKK